MRRGMWLSLAIAVAVGAVAVTAPPAPAQTKKLVFWTHWDQNPDFNKWYAEKGKEFAKKTGYEVEVVTIPYQGYEAKYLAAFIGKSGAPDIFMGMTHQWCGQYDFCDQMPADLAKIWDENLPKYMVPIGKWKGVRYGIPIEHGNFQQMYINVDMFKKAGLNPDKPPKTLDEWLAAMKKLTMPTQGRADAGRASPSGTRAIRSASPTSSCRSPTRRARGCSRPTSRRRPASPTAPRWWRRSRSSAISC